MATIVVRNGGGGGKNTLLSNFRVKKFVLNGKCVAPQVLSLVVDWMDADMNAVDCKKGVGFKKSK